MHQVQFHRISSKELGERIGIVEIEGIIADRFLRWIGHVVRMEQDRLPRKLLSSWMLGRTKQSLPNGSKTEVLQTHLDWVREHKDCEDQLKETLSKERQPRTLIAKGKSWYDIAKDDREEWSRVGKLAYHERPVKEKKKKNDEEEEEVIDFSSIVSYSSSEAALEEWDKEQARRDAKSKKEFSFPDKYKCKSDGHQIVIEKTMSYEVALELAELKKFNQPPITKVQLKTPSRQQRSKRRTLSNNTAQCSLAFCG